MPTSRLQRLACEAWNPVSVRLQKVLGKLNDVIPSKDEEYVE